MDLNRYRSRKIIVCPHCQGERKVHSYIEVPRPEKYEKVLVMCPICDGQGLVEQLTSIIKLNPNT